MKVEIGSEFWDVPVNYACSSVFPEHTQWFLSGRSALRAIIRELPWARSVAMPSWCCESMVRPFLEAGMEVVFYPVYMKDDLVQEIDLSCDVLYLMDYFGYTAQSKPDHNCVIRDVTHSIFSKTRNGGHYSFGSLRKWCGVWTGGFLWANDGHAVDTGNMFNKEYCSMRRNAMELKACYIKNQQQESLFSTKNRFLEIFSAAEELLDECEITSASERDINLAGILDSDLIFNKRRKNAKILMNEFEQWLVFPTLSERDCPLFVPVLVPDGRRDELRRYLTEHKIYCPIHWPKSKYHKLGSKEAYIYDNELSLVCDQRYDEEDMQRQIETVKSFLKEI